jgi:hypothetical protein
VAIVGCGPVGALLEGDWVLEMLSLAALVIAVIL